MQMSIEHAGWMIAALSSCFCGCLCAVGESGGASSKEGAKDALPTYRIRGGLTHVFAKLQAGQRVTVVYFGGSITAAAGWRVQMHQWLGKRFPNATIKMVNAGVGGTGSQLGVFRMDHDVLMHKPDLVFVEFAANDGTDAIRDPDQVRHTTEGIVRKIQRQDATTDICFLYTFHKRMAEQYDAGEWPASVAIMEALAEHYGIPTVNGGWYAYRLGRAGKLQVPGVATREGAPRFSVDDCHPTPHGHRVFTDLIAEAVETMLASPSQAAARPLPKPLWKDTYESAKLIDPSKVLTLSDDWEKRDTGRFHDRIQELWAASKPGATATVHFKGTDLFFYDLIGPETGQFSVKIDGRAAGTRLRFDKYCRTTRLGFVNVATGLDPTQEHTVTITVLPDPPVAPNADLESKGTTILIGGVMVLGEVRDNEKR